MITLGVQTIERGGSPEVHRKPFVSPFSPFRYNTSQFNISELGA